MTATTWQFDAQGLNQGCDCKSGNGMRNCLEGKRYGRSRNRFGMQAERVPPCCKLDAIRYVYAGTVECKLGNWKLAEDLLENLTATHSAQPPVVLNACTLCCNERENACAWKDAPGVTKRTAGLRAARADAIFAAGHNGAAC
jgi:hypothetical protein